MKKQYKILCALLVLFIVSPAMAGEPNLDIKKEKAINKAYLVNSDAGIDITNKYGNIYVTTWDEDKIAIDILIKVSGKKEEDVNKRLNSINVDIDALVNLVTAKTIIGSYSGRINTNMEINYTIRIPRKGGVKLNNQYGSIITDKILGRTDIDCKYGNITMGDLLFGFNDINIQYCDKSSIGNAKNAVVNAKYSSLTIAKVGNLILDASYTNTTVKDVDNLTYQSNYGDLNVANADNVSGAGNYMTLRFGTINKNLSINTNYSSVNVNAISAKANNFSLNTTYTNIILKYDVDFAFDFDINTRYSNLSSNGLTFQTKREANTSATYKGFYKNSGSNKVAITSNYGDVKLEKN